MTAMAVTSCQKVMGSSRYKQWDIWLADVRFEDTQEHKKRPVLIYNDVLYAVISYKMTSTDRGDNQKEYQIREWKAAGLENPTSVRLEKVLRLEAGDMICKIGRLTPRDILQIEYRLASRKQN